MKELRIILNRFRSKTKKKNITKKIVFSFIYNREAKLTMWFPNPETLIFLNEKAKNICHFMNNGGHILDFPHRWWMLDRIMKRNVSKHKQFIINLFNQDHKFRPNQVLWQKYSLDFTDMTSQFDIIYPSTTYEIQPNLIDCSLLTTFNSTHTQTKHVIKYLNKN